VRINGSEFAKRSLASASRPKTEQEIDDPRVEDEVSDRRDPNVCYMNVTAHRETGKETWKDEN
jgi:hypothetical protein